MKSFKLVLGHYLKVPPRRFTIERQDDGTVTRVFGVDVDRRASAILWPAYSEKIIRGSEEFILQAITTQAGRKAATAFLETEHGRKRAFGTTLALYMGSGDRRGSIVGCAVVAEDTHTNYRGRSAFATACLGADWRRLQYDVILRQLRLVTGKRYALATQFRGRQLGDVLAKHLGIAASTHRWPPADWLEVARHMPRSELLAAAADRSTDFLTRSGYVAVPPFCRSSATAHDRTASPADPLYFGYFYREVASYRGQFPELQAAVAAHV